MKKFGALILILLATACGSTQAAKEKDDDVPTPPPPGPSVDQRLSDMQTAMTELLERMDVLSDRIARIEQGEVAAAPAPAPASTPPVSEPTPSRAIVGAQIADNYRAALMLYGRGKLAESRKGFQQVFDSDPSGELADNALYWIGEIYFASKDYTNAIKYFRRVTNDYGDQNKAPDAAFKTGIALEKSGDLQLAKQAFDECVKRYPYSTSAASAKQELERIKF
ncbi:MAG TPA: tol-pal system protein YbgF [Thermoanaerobaculia bacterium]|nr:tol-pal system protein YbgF [Thermoanaerobaculia bacterium]